MRIISFSHAPMQAFWTAPVQALAPWITRIRHSFGHSAVSSIAQRSAGAAPATPSSFLPCTAPASNDAIFDVPTEMAGLPRLAMTQEPARSTLRVVRESDTAIKPDCAGRMVISGRMADVCAELDRMALQAAANLAD
ncbi:hypothetical protein [Polaromonas glacialis]|uniref:hypothetical protein n=1 Tax=Polaromonas glacialis TaxID=866564 RepID=UPI000495D286|nr:hypothetical protein [Polaromonas glacialis]